MRLHYIQPLLYVCFFISFLSCKMDKPTPVIEDKTAKQEQKKEDNLLEALDTETGVQDLTIWHSPKILIQQLGDLSDKIVANIGAGPYGYFSFQIVDKAKKVIAIDIDPSAIDFIENQREQLLPSALQNKLETRLVEPDNPKLRFEEADIVTIMDTYAYLPNRIEYLKNLRRGIVSGGKLLIVDFKMRKLPVGPPQAEKVPLFQVELDLVKAGYRIEWVDDRSFTYRYLLLAVNP